MKTKSITLILTTILFFAVSVINTGCDKTDPVDFSVLDALLADAQELYDSSVKGTLPGQYPEDAFVLLNAGLNEAEAVRNTEDVTQAEVDAAVEKLQLAIDSFQTMVVEQIQAEHLVLYLPFDGNANDASGNDLHGMLKAGYVEFGAGDPPSLTSDRYGNDNGAYAFENGGNIEIPYSEILSPEEITISFWVKKDVSSKLKDVIMALNRNNGYMVQTIAGNKIFATYHCINNGNSVYRDGYSGDAVLTDNAWVHVAVSYSDGDMRFYMDGALVHSLVDYGIMQSDPINLTIGCDLPVDMYTETPGAYYYGYGGFFNGSIDDIRIYDMQLDDSDIAAIYAMERP